MRLSVARLLEGFRQLKHRLSAKVAVAIIGVAAAVLIVAGCLSLWLLVSAQMATIAALHQLQAETAALKIQHFVDDLESHLRWLIAPSWASTTSPLVPTSTSRCVPR